MSGSTESVGSRDPQQVPSLPVDLNQFLQTLLGEGLSLRQIQQALYTAYGDSAFGAADQQSVLDFIRDLPQTLRAGLQDGGTDQLPPGQFRDLVESALDPARTPQAPQSFATPNDASINAPTNPIPLPAGVRVDHAGDPAVTARTVVDGSPGNAQQTIAGGNSAARSSTQSAVSAQHTQTDALFAAAIRTADNNAVALRSVDTGGPPVTTDRSAPTAQTQATANTPHARADAVPVQTLPQVAAGAALLVNPQVTPLPTTQVNMPLTPGTEQAAAQARNAAIVPAGHTVAGLFGRDLRERANAPQQAANWIQAQLPLRLKRTRTSAGDAEGNAFQWLFWVLTLVAYAGLIVAIIALIPGGSGLTDGFGRPSAGGIALILGGMAAIASWFVGKRAAQRAEDAR